MAPLSHHNVFAKLGDYLLRSPGTFREEARPCYAAGCFSMDTRHLPAGRVARSPLSKRN